MVPIVTGVTHLSIGEIIYIEGLSVRHPTDAGKPTIYLPTQRDPKNEDHQATPET